MRAPTFAFALFVVLQVARTAPTGGAAYSVELVELNEASAASAEAAEKTAAAQAETFQAAQAITAENTVNGRDVQVVSGFQELQAKKEATDTREEQEAKAKITEERKGKAAAEKEAKAEGQKTAAASAKGGLEAATKADLLKALRDQEMRSKESSTKAALAGGFPGVGCPEGTCTVDAADLQDQIGQPLRSRKCVKGTSVDGEWECPAMSFKEETANSASCVNCNRGGICKVFQGECVALDGGGTECGGCFYAPAGTSGSCTACPPLVEPAGDLDPYMRNRADLPCKRDCMECRTNMTGPGGILTHLCINVNRHNIHGKVNSSTYFQIPTGDDQFCNNIAADVKAKEEQDDLIYRGTRADGTSYKKSWWQNTDGVTPCEWNKPDEADTPAKDIFAAPDVQCPCGTVRTQHCTPAGVEATTCTVLPEGEMPEVKCGYDQGTEKQQTFTKCTFCNSNGTCTIGMAPGPKMGCTGTFCGGCQFADSLGKCQDCQALTGQAQGLANRDYRQRNGFPCKRACGECRARGNNPHDAADTVPWAQKCVNVMRYNLNNADQGILLKWPQYEWKPADARDGGEFDCEILPCEATPQSSGMPPAPTPDLNSFTLMSQQNAAQMMAEVSAMAGGNMSPDQELDA